MKKDEMILMDSPEAASIQTVTGWVSRDGFYWGKDERAARYSGCTHRKCDECGSVIAKNRVVCPTCSAEKARQKFEQMPVIAWDRETPLNLFDTDTYIFDEGDIDGVLDGLNDDIEEANKNVKEGESLKPFLTRADLRVVVCEPLKPGYFDPNEEWQDYLAEDGEVDDAGVLEAVEALNKALKASKPFCWVPGDKRVILEQNDAEHKSDE